MKKEIIEWIKSLIFAIVFVSILNIFITTTMVYSTSMYPTLIEKDMLVLKRTKNVERGDIVSFKSDLTIDKSDVSRLNFLQKLKTDVGDHKNLIKRVIGLPGDELEIRGNKVYINDKLFKEDYINTLTNGNIYIEKIPENQYFLMGDNRHASLDSRSSKVGLISKDKFIGKVLLRLFPLDRIKVF